MLLICKANGYLDAYNEAEKKEEPDWSGIRPSTNGAFWTYTYTWDENVNGTLEHFKLEYSYQHDAVQGPPVQTIKLTQPKNSSKTIDTPAYALQKNIATWYKALRTIALVGLLSVLVYLGIRIILSSASAQDKAKYKNMLKDWVAAVCILFLLHYAMAFMLQMTEQIDNILVAGDNKTDVFMNSVREQAKQSYEDASIGLTAGYSVMYLALVILTGVFTFQYLKRVIYVAFLTMIAPMIALTYPLDKVKDGKAQAFSFWLREYIFNCLIQPVHLLLYTVLIANEGMINVAENNIIYAIVALGFLVPAEKFVKKMFGLDSQSSVGTLSAAAGGAMVMNMLNKIKKKPSKEGGEKSGGSGSSKNGVRTTNGAQGGTDGGTPNLTGGGKPGTPDPGIPGSGEPVAQTVPSKNIGRGLKAAGRNMAIKGVDGIKSASLNLVKSAPGALLGATIGAAATVASGGENGAAFIGGGIAAGSALSNNITNGTVKFAKDTYADYQKGKFGTEAYNNEKTKKEFFKSEGYKIMAEDPSLLSAYGGEEGIKVAAKVFLNNGITDATQIREAMQLGITGEEYKAFSDAGVTNAKEIAGAKSKWQTPESYKIAKKVAPIAAEKTREEFLSWASDKGINRAGEIYDNMIELL